MQGGLTEDKQCTEQQRRQLGWSTSKIKFQVKVNRFFVKRDMSTTRQLEKAEKNLLLLCSQFLYDLDNYTGYLNRNESVRHYIDRSITAERRIDLDVTTALNKEVYPRNVSGVKIILKRERKWNDQIRCIG